MLAVYEDLLRWRRQGRDDILRIVETETAFSGTDGLGGGEYLSRCPFLVAEGDHSACAIYETRPQTCRDFRPGSTKCAQFAEG